MEWRVFPGLFAGGKANVMTVALLRRLNEQQLALQDAVRHAAGAIVGVVRVDHEGVEAEPHAPATRPQRRDDVLVFTTLHLRERATEEARAHALARTHCHAIGLLKAAERAVRDVVVLRCRSVSEPRDREAFILAAEEAFGRRGEPLDDELQALLLLAYY